MEIFALGRTASTRRAVCATLLNLVGVTSTIVFTDDGLSGQCIGAGSPHGAFPVTQMCFALFAFRCNKRFDTFKLRSAGASDLSSANEALCTTLSGTELRRASSMRHGKPCGRCLMITSRFPVQPSIPYAPKPGRCLQRYCRVDRRREAFLRPVPWSCQTRALHRSEPRCHINFLVGLLQPADLLFKLLGRVSQGQAESL